MSGRPADDETIHQANVSLPRISLSYVPPAAVARLRDSTPPLLVLRASIGFGKTSAAVHVLAHLRSMGHRVGWIPASSDGGATGFWSRLHETILAIDGPSPDGPRVEVTGNPDDIVETVLALRRPVTVAVDDLDAQLDEGIDATLVRLVGRSDLFHLIVTTSAPRPIVDLAPATVDGVLLQAHDLALSAEEMTWMAAFMGKSLSLEQATRLRREFVGWPAMVRAVLQLDAADADDDELAELAPIRVISGRAIAELPQHPHRRALALIIAGSTDIGADLVAFLGERDARRVERQMGIAVMSRRRDDDVWPVVLSRVAHEVLSEIEPDAVALTHRFLARRRSEQGQHAAALRHAVTAGDWSMAMRVVAKEWERLAAHHADLLVTLNSKLPHEVVVRSMPMLLVREVIGTGDIAQRADDALRARRLLPDGGLAGRLRGIRRVVGSEESEMLLVSRLLDRCGTELYRSGRDVTAAYVLGLAHEAAPEGSWQRSEIAASVAVVLAGLGHVHDALVWLGDAGADERSAATVETARHSIERVAAMTGLDESPVPAQAPSIDSHPGDPGLPEVVGIGLAFLWWRYGRPSKHGIEELLLVRAAMVDQGERPVRWRDAVSAHVVDAYIAAGMPQRAAEEYERHLSASSEFPELRARVALYCGDAERALSLSEEGAVLIPVSPRSGLELLLVRACAADALGRRELAVGALSMAVGVAEHFGLAASMCTVPREDLDRIARDLPLAADYLGTGALASTGSFFPPPLRVEALSPAELRVLRVLDESISAHALARRLFLSESTVKTHLQHIYRKLGVSNRREAIERAQILRLV